MEKIKFEFPDLNEINKEIDSSLKLIYQITDISEFIDQINDSNSKLIDQLLDSNKEFFLSH